MEHMSESDKYSRCHTCGSKKNVEERFSFGCYAGILCDECAKNGFIDHCGLDMNPGTQDDIEEPIEPEEY